jgi:hypothetical protein
VHCRSYRHAHYHSWGTGCVIGPRVYIAPRRSNRVYVAPRRRSGVVIRF